MWRYGHGIQIFVALFLSINLDYSHAVGVEGRLGTEKLNNNVLERGASRKCGRCQVTSKGSSAKQCFEIYRAISKFINFYLVEENHKKGFLSTMGSYLENLNP